MDIIKYKYWFIGFSGLLTVVAVASMLVFGFKQGIDFVGGTLWQVKFPSTVVLENLNNLLAEQKLEGLSIRQGNTSQDFVIRMKEVNEEKHQELLKLLNDKFGGAEELSFSSIGPAIGSELRRNAVTAFFLVLLGISLFCFKFSF